MDIPLISIADTTPRLSGEIAGMSTADQLDDPLRECRLELTQAPGRDPRVGRLAGRVAAMMPSRSTCGLVGNAAQGCPSCPRSTGAFILKGEALFRPYSPPSNNRTLLQTAIARVKRVSPQY